MKAICKKHQHIPMDFNDHQYCKRTSRAQVFRKSISRNTTHHYSQHLQAILTGEM